MKRTIIYVIYQLIIFTLFAQGSTQLFVHAPVLSTDDTLKIYLQKERVLESFRNPYRAFTTSNNNGLYRLRLDSLDAWTWISMNLSFQQLGEIEVMNIMDEVLLEEGDSVHVFLAPKWGRFASVEDGYNGNIPMMKDNWDANFLGRGSAKYEALWKIKLLNEENRKIELSKGFESENIFNRLKLQYQIQQESLFLLNSYKSKLSPEIYGLLVLRVKGQLGYEMGRMLSSLERYAAKKNDKNVTSDLRKYMDKYFEQASSSISGIDQTSILSPKFIDYLLEYTWLKFVDQYKGGGNVVREWYELSKGLVKPSFARDRILASILLKRFQDNPQIDLLDDALNTFEEPLSLSKIVDLRNLLLGSEAYAFSLPDVDGVYHNLGDYKGKVVFMDFWYASCLACHNYMRNVVSPVKKAFRDNPNVVFITVSTDNFNTFQKMLEKGDFLPNDGVHLYTDGKKFKHPIIEHYQIRAYPFPLLIDREGKLLTGMFNLNTAEGLTEGIEAALK